MKINFDLSLKNYKGDPIDGSIPDLIANMLLNPAFTAGGDIKKHDLAARIYKEKKIEIDASDFKLVMDAANFKGQQDRVGPAIRGPLLIALEDQEKKAKK